MDRGMIKQNVNFRIQVVACGRLTNVPLQIKAHILFLGTCEYVIRKKQNKNFADVIKNLDMKTLAWTIQVDPM